MILRDLMSRRRFVASLGASAIVAGVVARPHRTAAQILGQHFYLTRYVGKGSDVDPFRPLGADDAASWSAIDLRPAGAVIAGYALLAVPVRNDLPGQTYLGDDSKGTIGALTKVAIETTLLVTLAATTLDALVAELLLVHGKTDGMKWLPLTPIHLGLYEIWLGGLLYSAAAIKGGATITESFNTADSDILGPTLSWTELSGDWDVVSNQAKCLTNGVARADSDLASDDVYAQVEIPTPSASGDGPICRKDDSATLTFYHARLNSVPQAQLFKFVAGTATQLGATVGITRAAPDTVKVEADGSTIKCYYNGAEKISATDTAITANTRAGIRGFRNGIVDNFEAADLAASAVPLRSLMGVGT